MEYDVTIDRDKYVGGSDIPVIMGISSFNTRWGLMLEKAGLKENTFTGNKYTEYGHEMEPKIRAYINLRCTEDNAPIYEPNMVIDGDFRAHTDGFNGESVLEIKTTSHIYETVSDYKVYLVQLLKYMEVNNVNVGLLAVYSRPEDMSTEFDVDRLTIYDVVLDDYRELLAEVNRAIDRFLSDLASLRENPLLTEQDFFSDEPTELVSLADKVMAFESQLAELKAIEQQCKEAKAKLLAEMEKHDIKSWTTPNGTKIARVDGTPGSVKTVTEFDVDAFKAENPAMYGMYLHEVEKRTAGRSGYIKITLPR